MTSDKALLIVARDGAIYDIYEIEGTRANFKWWYGAVRDRARELGAAVYIQRAPNRKGRN